ncbi:putative phosphoserine phosphatase [Peptoniphilus sp. ING2-D1G]|nr:putative phosphoserine phosphatase [Peptoniphilus sp. ING2-D1G]
MLNKNSWTDYNYEILKNMIEEYKGDKKQKNFVVTDWDNTAASFDVEENVLLYQILNLKFAFEPDDIEKVLLHEIDDVPDVISKLVERIKDSYKILYKCRENIESIKDTEEYRDFTAGFSYFYFIYVNSLEYGLSSRKFLHVFYKMTEDELRAIAGEAINYFKNFNRKSMEFEMEVDGKRLHTRIQTGLREIPEQVDLINTMRKSNIDVYVCSASCKIVVEEFATSKDFQYGFKRDEIMAMIPLKDGEGRYTLELNKDNLTYLQGKARYLKKLEEKYNKPPVLYMGDSRGDYYALTYPGLKYSLIVDRDDFEMLNKLKELAKSKKFEDTIYMLQPFDKIEGKFISE